MFMVPDRIFSTDAIVKNKRLWAWREVISEIFYNVDIDDVCEENWQASIAEIRLEDLSFTKYVTEKARGTRCRAAISADTEEYYIFVFPISGSMFFSQSGRSGIVKANGYILLRSGELYQLSCDQSFQGYFLKVPTDALDRQYADAGLHCAGSEHANGAIAKVLLSVMTTASDLLPAERVKFGAGLQRQIIGMLGLMLQMENPDSECTSMARRQIVQRVLRLVEARYHVETFSPVSAAAELRISVGYLHRCLQTHGTTFAKMLRDARLARAYEILSQPTFSKQVAEVAFATGFADHSVFSIAFKQRYGQKPSDCRRGLRSSG